MLFSLHTALADADLGFVIDIETVVEEEISVKTLYNSGSEGWATFGDLGRIFVGTLLGSVMFTCDVFFEFVACLAGLRPVAIQRPICGRSERVFHKTSL